MNSLNTRRLGILSTSLLAIALAGCARPPFEFPDSSPLVKASPAATPEQAVDRSAKTEERDRTIRRALANTPPMRAESTTQPTPAAPPVELWTRIRQGMRLPLADNSRIRRERQWFVKRPEYLARVAKRARPWLYHIVTQTEQQGVPAEIALLPIVESAFQPFARSPSGAAGIWQFVRGTGRGYGLKQNWWYDGRRDVMASTRAAIQYLQKLHNDFDGDWLLAVAAYNCGEGNVAKAIKRNLKAGKPTDFWSLKLPRETRVYVPRLLAIAQVVAEPQDFGIALPTIANKPAIEHLVYASQVDLTAAAKASGLALRDIYAFNPGYKRWASDPRGPHSLVLPVKNARRLRDSGADLTVASGDTFVRHTIAKGESLSVIARRYHTDIRTLKTINKMRGSRIRAGRSLLVPQRNNRSDAAVALAQATGRFNKSTRTYTVRAGDSLWLIARRLNTTVRHIAAVNGLSKSSVLHPGQRLRLRGVKLAKRRTNRQKTTAGTTTRVRYVVRRGDSLWQIARRFQVRVADLKSWNNGLGSLLRPGQKVLVHTDPI